MNLLLTVFCSIYSGDIYQLYRIVNIDELDLEDINTLTGLSLQSFKFKALGDWSCQFCGALRFPGEVPGFCCSNGRVQLDPIQCPEVLEDLLYNNRQYVANARRYNNALAMASNGLKEILLPGYQPNVKIQGKVYHRIDPLTPAIGQERCFAQIYIHDSEFDEVDELNRRMEVSSTGKKKLNKKVMKKLQDLLHQINPYVKDFKHVMDLPEEDVKELKFVLKPLQNLNQITS